MAIPWRAGNGDTGRKKLMPETTSGDDRPTMWEVTENGHFPGFLRQLKKNAEKWENRLRCVTAYGFLASLPATRQQTKPNQSKPNDHLHPYRPAPKWSTPRLWQASWFTICGSCFLDRQQAQIAPVLSKSRRPSIRSNRALVLLLLNFPQITKPNQEKTNQWRKEREDRERSFFSPAFKWREKQIVRNLSLCCSNCVYACVYTMNQSGFTPVLVYSVRTN